MNRFYKTNFVFKANRYEEWQGGQCISQGPILTTVIAEVDENEIHFELDDIGEISMLKSFALDIYGEDYCILPDRIQYSRGTSDFNPVVPIVCNIFYRGNSMQYVRFAMTNPDRLVEFYGNLLDLGQPSTGIRSNKDNDSEATAEGIIEDLNSYGMVNADAIMERAVNLYNNNANVTSLEQAKAIIESLKLFVKAYQLDEKEHEEEERTSALKPKILMFIALCNYKIDNINRAYCIAKQGLDAVDKAIEDSCFTGIPRTMYGADTLQAIIDIIEKDRFDEVKDEDLYYNIDPEQIDTRIFDKIISQSKEKPTKPTKQEIKVMIDTISHIQSEFSKIGEKTGDGLQAFKLNQTFETFKMPLYYAWQGYDYGWHTDFCKEGDSLFPFMMFEMDIKNKTQQLIDILKDQSPFSQIERKSAITNSLISIYSRFIKDLDKGVISI